LRSIAPVFKRDGINVNAILPSFVVTNFVPAARAALIPPPLITGMETVIAAYDKFLDDPTLSGEALEIHPNTTFVRKVPEYAHESMKFFEMATRLDDKPRVSK
jgi:NAD(P)-dependent dehydrogenase (short-subunit alcohol dehydrogenase family)